MDPFTEENINKVIETELYKKLVAFMGKRWRDVAAERPPVNGGYKGFTCTLKPLHEQLERITKEMPNISYEARVAFVIARMRC